MLRIVAAGASAFFIAGSILAYAQSPPAVASNQLNAADRNTLTDMRIDLVKAALQLTPDQTKYWPVIESAIRTRVQDRQARVAKIAETVGAKAAESPIDILRDRDPVNFLQRRADALAQRSARPQEARGRMAAALYDPQPRTETTYGGSFDLCSSGYE